jgi:hypothetical protein
MRDGRGVASTGGDSSMSVYGCSCFTVPAANSTGLPCGVCRYASPQAALPSCSASRLKLDSLGITRLSILPRYWLNGGTTCEGR